MASIDRPVARVLVAGATGRLGEAVLNEALARIASRSPGAGVFALAQPGADMSFGVRGLSLASFDALPALDAVVIVQSDPQADDARSFNGRDAPFTLVEASAVPRIAHAAVDAGARRLVLLHAVPAWQQMSGLHRGLIGVAELEISTLPFESVVLMRPLANRRTPGGNWLQRVAQVYLSLQFLMLPRSLPTLTSVQVARVAIDQLDDPATGVRSLGAADIEARWQASRMGAELSDTV